MPPRVTTRCPRGHPYKPSNLVFRKNGVKMCKTCHQGRERVRYHYKLMVKAIFEKYANPNWRDEMTNDEKIQALVREVLDDREAKGLTREDSATWLGKEVRKRLNLSFPSVALAAASEFSRLGFRVVHVPHGKTGIVRHWITDRES